MIEIGGVSVIETEMNNETLLINLPVIIEKLYSARIEIILRDFFIKDKPSR